MTTNNNATINTPPLNEIKFNDTFWKPKIDTNRNVTLAIEHQQLASTHRLEILDKTWNKDSSYEPHIFWDSDIAKWLEAAAYSLHSNPDPKLEKQCDEVIEKLAKLQDVDGYLNSYFSQAEPDARWTNVRDRHELYCAGHLMEAAAAYYEATGKKTFLEVMSRYADYIASVFGAGEGKKKGYPGHEEIELALVKLYHATGKAEHLSLSKYFIDQRGVSPHYYDEESIARRENPTSYRHGRYDYCQAHLPVREQSTAEGHSVRAGYLYAGMADIARETGDAELLAACKRIWDNITKKRMYIIGGIGSSHVGERFTYDYDLPNEEVYAETCAAIALVFFAHRLFLAEPKAEYFDVLERSLYNGVMSGVSQDGKRFFYDNYLASHPGYHDYRARKTPERQEWFGCACCPPNIARLIASVGKYAFAYTSTDLYVNLYAGYSGRAKIANTNLQFSLETQYPWDGAVQLALAPEGPADFAVRLRIPGWCKSYSVTINGAEPDNPPKLNNGYLVISRSWHTGDTIGFTMDMKVEKIKAHPSVRHNVGRVALQRGPVVYCLEEADNGKDLNNIFLSDYVNLTWSFDEQLLGGTGSITGEGFSRSSDMWDDALYLPELEETRIRRTLKAIPYYLWNNRGTGEMLVWINSAVSGG